MKEKTFKEELIYEGKILKLKKHYVELENGSTSIREIVEHNGAVAILVEDNDKILFVKQYRKAFEEIVLEIPAGKLEKNEVPIECAKRELEEETGFIAGNLQLLQKIYPSPGFCNEVIYLYKATKLTVGQVNLDEDEELIVEWIEKVKVRKMIEERKFRDGKTLIGLLWIISGLV